MNRWIFSAGGWNFMTLHISVRLKACGCLLRNSAVWGLFIYIQKILGFLLSWIFKLIQGFAQNCKKPIFIKIFLFSFMNTSQFHAKYHPKQNLFTRTETLVDYAMFKSLTKSKHMQGQLLLSLWKEKSSYGIFCHIYFIRVLF